MNELNAIYNKFSIKNLKEITIDNIKRKNIVFNLGKNFYSNYIDFLSKKSIADIRVEEFKISALKSVDATAYKKQGINTKQELYKSITSNLQEIKEYEIEEQQRNLAFNDLNLKNISSNCVYYSYASKIKKEKDIQRRKLGNILSLIRQMGEINDTMNEIYKDLQETSTNIDTKKYSDFRRNILVDNFGSVCLETVKSVNTDSITVSCTCCCNDFEIKKPVFKFIEKNFEKLIIEEVCDYIKYNVDIVSIECPHCNQKHFIPKDVYINLIGRFLGVKIEDFDNDIDFFSSRYKNKFSSYAYLEKKDLIIFDVKQNDIKYSLNNIYAEAIKLVKKTTGINSDFVKNYYFRPKVEIDYKKEDNFNDAETLTEFLSNLLKNSFVKKNINDEMNEIKIEKTVYSVENILKYYNNEFKKSVNYDGMFRTIEYFGSWAKMIYILFNSYGEKNIKEYMPENIYEFYIKKLKEENVLQDFSSGYFSMNNLQLRSKSFQNFMMYKDFSDYALWNEHYEKDDKIKAFSKRMFDNDENALKNINNNFLNIIKKDIESIFYRVKEANEDLLKLFIERANIEYTYNNFGVKNVEYSKDLAYSLMYFIILGYRLPENSPFFYKNYYESAFKALKEICSKNSDMFRQMPLFSDLEIADFVTKAFVKAGFNEEFLRWIGNTDIDYFKLNYQQRLYLMIKLVKIFKMTVEDSEINILLQNDNAIKCFEDYYFKYDKDDSLWTLSALSINGLRRMFNVQEDSLNYIKKTFESFKNTNTWQGSILSIAPNLI